MNHRTDKERKMTKEEALGHLARYIYPGQLLTQSKIDRVEKIFRLHWNGLSVAAHAIHEAHEAEFQMHANDSGIGKQ